MRGLTLPDMKICHNAGIPGEICILFAKSSQKHCCLYSNPQISSFSATFFPKQINARRNFQKLLEFCYHFVYHRAISKKEIPIVWAWMLMANHVHLFETGPGFRL